VHNDLFYDRVDAGAGLNLKAGQATIQLKSASNDLVFSLCGSGERTGQLSPDGLGDAGLAIERRQQNDR
jgi:hypothetical protein